MAVSVSGRSRHGDGATRSYRSKLSARRRTTKPPSDDVAEKPDLEELRRRRIAYLSASPQARKKLSAAVTVKSASNDRLISSTGKPADLENRRRKRKHKSRSTKDGRTTNDSIRSRTEDYVYGRAGHSSSVTREDHIGNGKRRSKDTSSSRRNSLPTVLESEVTPDDSVSQIGMPRSRNLAKGNIRPTQKRSGPSSKRPPVSEIATEGNASAATTQKSSKRDSTSSLLGLGSFFRRNTAPAVPTTPRLVECLTCAADDVPYTQSAKLACGHRMCFDCLKRIFEMSVKDPVHMPPRCCTTHHIPLKHVDKLFDLKFKILWNRKYQEYHTKNRIYCPAPKCGEWIKPTNIHTSQGRKYAQCPRCHTKVCTSCNAKLHKSQECPKDPEIARLVEQAKEKGWQSCYNCKALVELKEGCNHMTCRCLAEFCMICAGKWKTCDCPWFNYAPIPDQDRLNEWRVPEHIQIVFRRAMGVPDPVQQQPRPNPPPPPPAQPPDHQRQRTYMQELDQRRQQERSDADLARRMQLASLLDPDEETMGRQRADVGLGNVAAHFTNDNFVQNAANVVMSAFGDATTRHRSDRPPRRPR